MSNSPSRRRQRQYARAVGASYTPETYCAPFVKVRPSMLTPQKVVVAAEGELVTITVNNSTMKMGYEDALKLSQWIRMRAKEAKRFAGDTSRHWSLLAQLDGIKT